MLSTRRIWRAPLLGAAICAGLAFAGTSDAHANGPTPPNAPARAAVAAPLTPATTKKTTTTQKAPPAKSATTKTTTTGPGSTNPKTKSTATSKSPAPAKGTIPVERGIAMHYYPGLFATVARNRGMALRKDVDGYASRQNCGELGRVVQARIRNPWTGAWGPWRRYQIVDCSARKHLAYQRRIGLILEVDYSSAVKAGFVYFGRSAVEVKR